MERSLLPGRATIVGLTNGIADARFSRCDAVVHPQATQKRCAVAAGLRTPATMTPESFGSPTATPWRTGDGGSRVAFGTPPAQWLYLPRARAQGIQPAGPRSPASRATERGDDRNPPRQRPADVKKRRTPAPVVPPLLWGIIWARQGDGAKSGFECCLRGEPPESFIRWSFLPCSRRFGHGCGERTHVAVPTKNRKSPKSRHTLNSTPTQSPGP